MHGFSRAALILTGWTVFVWVSRVRNVLADDDLDGVGRGIRLAIVAIFVGLAALALWAWRHPGRPIPTGVAVRLLAGWTAAFWLVRGIGIIVDDHDLGFTVVHTALMVVSIGLAAWAWISTAALRSGVHGTADHPAPLDIAASGRAPLRDQPQPDRDGS